MIDEKQMTQITLTEFQKLQLRRQHALFGIKQLKIGGSFSHLPRRKDLNCPCVATATYWTFLWKLMLYHHLLQLDYVDHT